MGLDPETWRWLKDWGAKIGATAYLLCVFAFMAGHPRPGSLASLTFGLTMAIVPAALGTLAALGVMLYLRKR